MHNTPNMNCLITEKFTNNTSVNNIDVEQRVIYISSTSIQTSPASNGRIG